LQFAPHFITIAFVVATSSPGKAAPVVAVIEDDPNIQSLLVRMLQLHGFDPVLATDLPTLVIIATSHRVGAFLLDLHLSHGQSGLDLLEWLRSQPSYVDTPVLVFTGETVMPDHLEQTITRHRAYVFHKGQRLQPLMDRLKQLLASDKPE
jgi:DNA-binding response OmpR family regulator